MFHKIKSVAHYADLKISVTFDDDTTKLYDVEPLLDKRLEFKAFEHNPSLIKYAYVAPGGYGVIWNDEIDFSSEEIWANGTAVDKTSVSSNA